MPTVRITLRQTGAPSRVTSRACGEARDALRRVFYSKGRGVAARPMNVQNLLFAIPLSARADPRVALYVSLMVSVGGSQFQGFVVGGRRFVDDVTVHHVPRESRAYIEALCANFLRLCFSHVRVQFGDRAPIDYVTAKRLKGGAVDAEPWARGEAFTRVFHPTRHAYRAPPYGGMALEPIPEQGDRCRLGDALGHVRGLGCISTEARNVNSDEGTVDWTMRNVLARATERTLRSPFGQIDFEGIRRDLESTPYAGAFGRVIMRRLAPWYVTVAHGGGVFRVIAEVALKYFWALGPEDIGFERTYAAFINDQLDAQRSPALTRTLAFANNRGYAADASRSAMDALFLPLEYNCARDADAWPRGGGGGDGRGGVFKPNFAIAMERRLTSIDIAAARAADAREDYSFTLFDIRNILSQSIHGLNAIHFAGHMHDDVAERNIFISRATLRVVRPKPQLMLYAMRNGQRDRGSWLVPLYAVADRARYRAGSRTWTGRRFLRIDKVAARRYRVFLVEKPECYATGPSKHQFGGIGFWEAVGLRYAALIAKFSFLYRMQRQFSHLSGINEIFGDNVARLYELEYRGKSLRALYGELSSGTTATEIRDVDLRSFTYEPHACRAQITLGDDGGEPSPERTHLLDLLTAQGGYVTAWPSETVPVLVDYRSEHDRLLRSSKGRVWEGSIGDYGNVVPLSVGCADKGDREASRWGFPTCFWREVNGITSSLLRVFVSSIKRSVTELKNKRPERRSASGRERDAIVAEVRATADALELSIVEGRGDMIVVPEDEEAAGITTSTPLMSTPLRRLGEDDMKKVFTPMRPDDASRVLRRLRDAETAERRGSGDVTPPRDARVSAADVETARLVQQLVRYIALMSGAARFEERAASRNRHDIERFVRFNNPGYPLLDASRPQSVDVFSPLFPKAEVPRSR